MWFFIFQSVALLSVACAFGVFAGWLFWGGETAPTVQPGPVQAKTLLDGEPAAPSIVAELEARTVAVARLRQKLKRAVVELERRTEQLAEAREERETLQLHVDALASQLVTSSEVSTVSAAPSVLAITDALTPEGIAPAADVIERAQALLAAAEARTEEAQRRAVAAEEEMEILRAALASTERDRDGQLASLELDLSSARLRADAASKELLDFASELKTLREANASYVETTTATMQELQARVEVAKSALSGKANNVARAPEPATRASLYDLVSLPGMSHDLAAELRDIGVQSVTDIAGWTSDDVERFQNWLPDHPGVIVGNSWVDVARSLVAEAEASPELGGGVDEASDGSETSGVFFDARAHSELAG